jgi:hypothetical protein
MKLSKTKPRLGCARKTWHATTARPLAGKTNVDDQTQHRCNDRGDFHASAKKSHLIDLQRRARIFSVMHVTTKCHSR